MNNDFPPRYFSLHVQIQIENPCVTNMYEFSGKNYSKTIAAWVSDRFRKYYLKLWYSSTVWKQRMVTTSFVFGKWSEKQNIHAYVYKRNSWNISFILKSVQLKRPLRVCYYNKNHVQILTVTLLFVLIKIIALLSLFVLETKHKLKLKKRRINLNWIN